MMTMNRTNEEFFRDLKSDLDQVFKSNEFKFADEDSISQYVEQVREIISEQIGIPVDDIEMRRIQDKPFVYKVIVHGPKYTEIELEVDP